MARGAKTDPWVTTEQVAAAVNVTPATIRRWGRERVLPAQTIVHMGRRGTQARWPLHAPDQARWVLDMLERGHTFQEIRSALERGEFAPSAPGDPDPE